VSNIWILPYIFEFRRHIFEFRKRRLLIYRPRLRQESCWERHSPFDLTRSHREQLCVAWVATDSWKQPHFSPTFLRNLIFPSTEILEKTIFFNIIHLSIEGLFTWLHVCTPGWRVVLGPGQWAFVLVQNVLFDKPELRHIPKEIRLEIVQWSSICELICFFTRIQHKAAACLKGQTLTKKERGWKQTRRIVQIFGTKKRCWGSKWPNSMCDVQQDRRW